MSQFKVPPIVMEYKRQHNTIVTKDKKVWCIEDAIEFPIGKVFSKVLDGKKYKFKVKEHRYIGRKLIAIILEDA